MAAQPTAQSVCAKGGGPHLKRVRSAMAPLTTVEAVALKAQPKNQRTQYVLVSECLLAEKKPCTPMMGLSPHSLMAKA